MPSFSAIPSPPAPPARRSPTAAPLLLGLCGLCAPVLVTGCAGESPALEVAGASFDAGDLASFSEDQVVLLGGLASVAYGAATGAWDEIGSLRTEQETRLRLGDRLREEVILEGAGVSESDLEQRYAAAPEYELVVRHLVVLSERWEPAAARATARDRAEAGLARIRGGEPFETVVAEVSEEPGAAARGGLLRPGQRGTWVEEFWTAATGLQEGEISSVVESPFGFHVLRLEERRILPFSDARPTVVRRVAEGLGGGAHWEETRESWAAQLELDNLEAATLLTAHGVLPLAAGNPAVLPDAEAVLARWPNGTLTASAFRSHLLALPARTLRRLGTDPTALELELRRAAEVHYLAQLAAARGLAPTEADEAAQLRAWEAEAGEWSAFLGFQAGMSAEERGERVLAAMRLTGQNARIARDAVSEAAPTLLGGVPVVIRDVPGVQP